MECLKYYQFFNNLMGLPLILEDEKVLQVRWKYLRMVYQRTTELIVLIGCMLQIPAISTVWADMNIFCGWLSSCTHSMQVLAKTIILDHYRKDFKIFLEIIETVHRRSNVFETEILGRNCDFMENYLKRSVHVRLMLIIHFTMTFCSTSAYFFPVIYESIVYNDSVDNQLPPIVIYLPFNFNWTPLYQAIVLFLALCFFLNNLKTVVIDNFILGLIVLSTCHLSYQDKLLKESLAKYFPEDDNGENLEDATSLVNRKKFILREWTIAHQKQLEAVRQFQGIISPYLLIEFSYILIHTCVPAFVITSTVSWSVSQKMAVFFIVGGGLVHLMILSRSGDNFTQSWSTVDENLFRKNLYRREEKWIFHYFTMLKMRLKKPFQLSAFGLFPLSSVTFLTIVRLIVSHYITLNQIQAMKNIRN